MVYSQNLEEESILKYFGDFVGVFLDIGCNDCVTFSNTRALAMKGWKGIFIDPSSAIERCKDIYKGQKGHYFYNWAISKHNGKEILQESGSLLGVADVGLVSTFHQHEKERFHRTVKYNQVEVKTYKWKTAYNRFVHKKYDMISLDVEGDELNILPDIDLSETRLICIEWNSKPELKVEYEKYLDGFNLIYTSGENLIYAR